MAGKQGGRPQMLAPTLIVGALVAVLSPRRTSSNFAIMLLAALLILNLLLNPARFAPSTLSETFGLAAPLVLAAMASTPVVLSGRGGIDLSVGPLMGLINVLIVHYLFRTLGENSPAVVVVFAVAIGLASGLVNGFLAAAIRIQPIVATLSTYLVYTGLAVYIMPTPGGSVPPWLSSLAAGLSWLPVAVVVLIWWALTRTPFYEHLMATGGDDRAAYSSGVDVTLVRVVAYAISGLFGSVAALSMTALLGSGDPTIGPTYTLAAIASVALGGVSLGGGRGGLAAAAVGAMNIFMLQSVLTFFNVSNFALQMAYGMILVLAVIMNTVIARREMSF